MTGQGTVAVTVVVAPRGQPHAPSPSHPGTTTGTTHLPFTGAPLDVLGALGALALLLGAVLTRALTPRRRGAPPRRWEIS